MLPGKMDLPLGHRQCAMLDRIGRQFMQRETDVLCRDRTQYQVRALIMYPRPFLLHERGKLARRQIVKRNTMPILIGDEVMSMSKTLDAGCQTRNIIFNGLALRRCLPGDSLHDGQQILGAVCQFTHQRANMLFAQFAARQFLLIAGDGVASRKAQLELVHDDGGQRVEDRYLVFACDPGHKVDHAKCAQVEAIRGAQRDTEVKLDARLLSDQRISQRPRIGFGVVYDPRPLLKNAGGAKAGIAVDLLNVEPVVRLEPDAIVIDDTDDGYRDTHYQGGEGSNPIEGTVGRGIQNVVATHSV